jgi:hypothetical protein
MLLTVKVQLVLCFYIAVCLIINPLPPNDIRMCVCVCVCVVPHR